MKPTDRTPIIRIMSASCSSILRTISTAETLLRYCCSSALQQPTAAGRDHHVWKVVKNVQLIIDNIGHHPQHRALSSSSTCTAVVHDVGPSSPTATQQPFPVSNSNEQKHSTTMSDRRQRPRLLIELKLALESSSPCESS